MTDNALTVVPKVRPAELPALPYGEFWPLVARLYELVKSDPHDRTQWVLQQAPTPADRALIAIAQDVCKEAARRLVPHEPDVLKAELGKLVLHYPTKRLTEAQFTLWADGYHKILAEYPAELLVEVCLEWLANVADRMPTPADLKQHCDRLNYPRKIRAQYAAAAPLALTRWDQENQRKEAAHG